LIYGLTRGERVGFGEALTLACLVGAVKLASVFVLAERRAVDALVPFRLFRLPTLAAHLASMAMSALAARLAEPIGVNPLLLTGLAALIGATVVLSRVSLGGSYLSDVLPGMTHFAVGLAFSYSTTAIGGTAGVPDATKALRAASSTPSTKSAVPSGSPSWRPRPRPQAKEPRKAPMRRSSTAFAPPSWPRSCSLYRRRGHSDAHS
jgi:hypothetical protein